MRWRSGPTRRDDGLGGGAEPRRHEPDAVKANAVALGGALLLLGIALVLLATGGYFRAVSGPEGHATVTLSPAEIATLKASREWARPSELAALQRAERRNLESYGWVDRPSGVVRIPVERAMALIASGDVEMPGRRGSGGAVPATSRPTSGAGRIR